MKKMMVAVFAMAAAFAAAADDALPSFKFAGFTLGDKVDAAVCKARGLSAPQKVVVVEMGTVCYRCKCATKSEGFDEVQLLLSSDSRIISIVGLLHTSDEATSIRKAKELAAKYKAELGSRESADGTMVLAITYGGDFVEVKLSIRSYERLSAAL